MLETRTTRNVAVNTHHPQFPNNTVVNTKYTLMNFLPKTLIDQFRRSINQYFLIIALLQLNDKLTPVHPATTWGPLGVVLAISIAKELVDDRRRRLADRAQNQRLYTVCRRGKLQKVMSAELHVGDVLLIKQDEEIPADMVVLKSSDTDGSCFIQTTNLDGEANLKGRRALSATSTLPDSQIACFRGVIKCASPNPVIYSFDANLSLSWAPTVKLPLGTEQLLLAATHLRNTAYVFGAVVYTGADTKFGCNKRDPPYKAPRVDKIIDRIAMVIFCCQLCLAIGFGAAGYDWYDHQGRSLLYLGFEGSMLPANGVWPALSYTLVYPLRFLMLISVMIPISLRITLELCRIAYAKWITWDLKMVDPETGVHATAQSTSLAEDLGQIQYVMTDKTGTLTENIMSFKKCSINGTLYGHSAADSDIWTDKALRELIKGGEEVALDFLRCLALNHTAMPVRIGTRGLKYVSASPDEESLCTAAAMLGVHLIERNAHEMRLWFAKGKERRVGEKWELLHTLEFSSERKMMSVIVRERLPQGKGRIRIFCKGADDRVLTRLWPGQDSAPTRRHIEFLSDLGLRTLVMGCRDVSEDEYAIWLRRFEQASAAVVDRDVKLELVQDEIERNLMLLGASAIEDKLQPGVPEAIAELRRANIRFWLLTGDKHATAVQVARSCALLSAPGPESFVIDIVGNNEDEVGECIREHLQSISEDKYTVKGKQATAELSIVIEGNALTHALAPGRRDDFRHLVLMARTVICCRVSPAQKAQVVRLVKETGSLTLAIGDGGNDVPMIQEAHIGVGISGREGLQAARASDYSIARFRFLSRLLTVHGRYAYQRTSTVALYSFYRSVLLCFVQLFHNASTGFSGTSLIHSLFFSAWSIITLPLAFSLALDRDVAEESCSAFPRIYTEGQRGTSLNMSVFCRWFAQGVGQAAIVYYCVVDMFGTSYMHPSDGSPDGHVAVGMAVYSTCFVLQILVVYLTHHRLSLLNHALILGTLILYIVLFAVFSNLPSFTFGDVHLLHRSFDRLGSDHIFVLGITTVAMAAVLPLLGFNLLTYFFRPALFQVVQFHEAKVARAARGGGTFNMSMGSRKQLLGLGSSKKGLGSAIARHAAEQSTRDDDEAHTSLAREAAQ